MKRLIVIDICTEDISPTRHTIEVWIETGKRCEVQELISMRKLLVGRRSKEGVNLLRALYRQKTASALFLGIERHMFITRK